jgi:hypothetical protein
MQIELLRQKAGIFPPGSFRLVWDAPEVLCKQEAFKNALTIVERLRCCGVSEAALSSTAAKCPQLLATQVSALPSEGKRILLLLAFVLRDLTAALWRLVYSILSLACW